MLAELLQYSGAFWLWGLIRRSILGRSEICVLALHRVLTDPEASHSGSHPAIVLRESTFHRLLRHLSSQWGVLSMAEFLAGAPAIMDRSRPLCLLTFDDGWRDNHSVAFPALRSMGLPATVFITTGYIEHTYSPWVEALIAAAQNPSVQERLCKRWGAADLDFVIERLKRVPTAERNELLRELLPGGSTPPALVDQMMTWEQVREMAQHGIEFGGHSVTHPLLIYEDDATVEREIRGCREVLERELGRKVRSFAYPNGDWDDRVRDAVRRAGFECAFTTESGWHDLRSDPYTIRRITIHEGNVTGRDGRFSPAAFNLTVSGWL